MLKSNKRNSITPTYDKFEKRKIRYTILYYFNVRIQYNNNFIVFICLTTKYI